MKKYFILATLVSFLFIGNISGYASDFMGVYSSPISDKDRKEIIEGDGSIKLNSLVFEKDIIVKNRNYFLNGRFLINGKQEYKFVNINSDYILLTKEGNKEHIFVGKDISEVLNDRILNNITEGNVIDSYDKFPISQKIIFSKGKLHSYPKLLNKIKIIKTYVDFINKDIFLTPDGLKAFTYPLWSPASIECESFPSNNKEISEKLKIAMKQNKSPCGKNSFPSPMFLENSKTGEKYIFKALKVIDVE